MNHLFYRPEHAWVGDVIPFYKDGSFRIFYLHDPRIDGKYGEATSWFELRTSDFVNFLEKGESLPHGTMDEQDYNCYTGSVVEAEGVYHLFYTGHNPNKEFCEDGEPLQCVMHAVSDDMEHWRKIPEDTFYSDGITYERHDWRDPFVFWNEEAEEYWMLLAARMKSGPSRRRGCTALCASKDLENWEIREPFWAPGLYVTHECPDLFKIGEWWYMVYSTFSDRFVTHYRMSSSLEGPWIAPYHDAFDNRAFYAAKTWSDGEKRFAFGWNPSKIEENDFNEWQWAGNLVIHEIEQQGDGTLTVKVPNSIDEYFDQLHPNKLTLALGPWVNKNEAWTVDVPDSFACVTGGAMPDRCKITTSISFGENTQGCGIMLRSSDNLEEAYYIRLEPKRNRLVFDMWPRRDKGSFQWQIAGDRPHMVELEIPLKLNSSETYEMKVFVDNSVCEVYVADQIAMSARLYNLKQGNWGFFVNEGKATFESVSLHVHQEN